MMSIPEILDQARALNPQERRALLKALVDILDEPAGPEPVPAEPRGHWGQNLLRLLDEIGPVELAHPEIEDPVEWVKEIRREQRQQRLGDWGDEE